MITNMSPTISGHCIPYPVQVVGNLSVHSIVSTLKTKLNSKLAM